MVLHRRKVTHFCAHFFAICTADYLYQVTVVGTKCDLKKQRQVSRERAMILMDELELKYYEASGVTGHNVEHIFTDIVERIIDMKETESKKEIIMRMNFDVITNLHMYMLLYHNMAGLLWMAFVNLFQL